MSEQLTAEQSVASPRRRSKLVRAWLLRLVLWLGLVLCGVVVVTQAPRSGISYRDALLVTTQALPLLVAAWLLSVAAWRQVVHMCTGKRLSWVWAIRQQGLLLVGKYVPGGVFGFLARASDLRPGDSRSAHFFAGLVEQLLGLVLTFAVGLIFLASAEFKSYWFLFLIVSLPLLGTWAFWLLRQGARRLPNWRGLRALGELSLSPMRVRPTLLACTFVLGVAIALMAVASLIALHLGGDLRASIGVAGAFAVAVVAGILVVIAPGGIGAREAVFVALASPWLGGAEALLIAVHMRLLTSGLDGMAGLAALLVGRFGQTSEDTSN